MSAPPAVEWTLGLVGHVLVDSVIRGYATALELTVIPRLVHERIQLLLDVEKSALASLRGSRCLFVGRDEIA